VTNYIESSVLTKVKKPLDIIQLKFPKLLYGQVMVKIYYSGVCRSQLMEKNGFRGKDKWLPHLLGHEGSGVVVKIGKGVKKVKNGDQVILSWIKSSGINSRNPEYLTKTNKKINSGKITTFSNYAVISENRIVKKPKLMPLKYAPLFGCAIPTGAGIVLNQIKPKQNDVVMVLGLGGVGLSSIMALKALRIKKIIALDRNRIKLKLAKEIGATNTIQITEKDIKNKNFRLFYKLNADYCIESTGLASIIELGFSLINKNGKLVFASHPPANKKIKLSPHDLISGKKIEGSWGGSCNPDKDIPKIFKLFLKNKIKYKYIAKKIYKLSQINEAMSDLDTGKVLRPIIKMKH